MQPEVPPSTHIVLGLDRRSTSDSVNDLLDRQAGFQDGKTPLVLEDHHVGFIDLLHAALKRSEIQVAVRYGSVLGAYVSSGVDFNEKGFEASSSVEHEAFSGGGIE